MHMIMCGSEYVGDVCLCYMHACFNSMRHYVPPGYCFSLPYSDELDSPMFQTVGHWAVEAIAKCMDLPLFSQQLHGKCVNDSLHYKPAEKDEVEDMLTLLQTVKVS